MSLASNYLLYDKSFSFEYSIPKCFYNFLLFIDMDRHQLITKYKLKEKVNIYQLWKSISMNDRLVFLINSNYQNSKNDLGNYCLSESDMIKGEIFFDYLQKTFSRELLVKIFGLELGGNHLWDGQYPNPEIEPFLSVYARLDPCNQSNFEKEIAFEWTKEFNQNMKDK